MNPELGLVLKATALLAFTGLLAASMRRASASARHGVWTIGLLCVLALPVVSWLGPRMELPLLSARMPQTLTRASVLEEETRPAPAAPVAAAIEPPAVFPAPSAVAGSSRLLPTTRAKRIPTRQWLFALWFAGTVFVLVRLLRATWLVRELRQGSSRVSDPEWLRLLEVFKVCSARSRRIELRIGGQMPPMTWGIRKHVVLLPETAMAWNAERRVAVLAHELAHVRRRDGLVQILAYAACSLYWFHPLAWYAARRIRFEQEKACDDSVVTLGVDPDVYAIHLVQIARRVTPGVSLATVSMGHHAQLEDRVTALLNPMVRRYRISRTATSCLFCFLGALTVLFAAIRVTAVASLEIPAFGFPQAPVVERVSTPYAVEAAARGPAEGGGRIGGRVVHMGTSEPLEEIQLTFTSQAGEVRRIRTDSEGRFELSNVAPDRYTITLLGEGYAQPKQDGGPGVLTLAPRQEIRDALFKMVRTGTISGRISDANGNPMVGISVEAVRWTYRVDAQGTPTFASSGSFQTNDRGEYRVYWLEPGEYYIRSWKFMVQLNGPAELNGQTFYPGTLNPNEAKPVVLAQGSEASGIDFTMRPASVLRVSGKILPPPLGNERLSIIAVRRGTNAIGDANGSLLTNLQRNTGQGDFEVLGLRAGFYDLYALIVDEQNRTRVGRAAINLETANLTGLTIPVVPPAEVRGTIAFDIGSTPVRMDALKLTLRLREAAPTPKPAVVDIASGSGAFKIANVPAGSYDVEMAAGLPATAYVADVLQDGKSIHDSGLLVASPTPEPIKVVLGTRGGSIEGVVQQASPIPFTAVELVPARRQNSGLYKATTTDGAGHFVFKGVPPGDYKLFAWQEIREGAWRNADTVSAFEAHGTPVHLAGPGDSVTNVRVNFITTEKAR